MAQWIEVTANELFEKGSHTLWTGLTDTITAFEVNKTNGNLGTVTKTNSRGRKLWQRVVVKGNHAYRITSGGVRRLPLIENDPDNVRRLARTLGWPLTWIITLEKGVAFEYRPRCQGDDGKYSLQEGENIRVVSLWTNGNPEWVTYIFVRKGAQPTWEEAMSALRIHAQNGDEQPTFADAVKKSRLG